MGTTQILDNVFLGNKRERYIKRRKKVIKWPTSLLPLSFGSLQGNKKSNLFKGKLSHFLSTKVLTFFLHAQELFLIFYR